MDNFASAMNFIGPLVGEAVSLLGRFLAASQQDRLALIEQRDSAVAEMRLARIEEEVAHDKRMSEAQTEIDARAKEPTP